MPRPTLRTAAPFALIALLGVVSLFLPPFSGDVVEPVAVVVLYVAVLGFMLVSLRRTRRSWIEPVGPWLFFVVIALGRYTTEGAASGLGPLVVLPIVWLATVGTRRDLMISAVLTALTFLVPLVVLGEPRYPPKEWRRALVCPPSRSWSDPPSRPSYAAWPPRRAASARVQPSWARSCGAPG